MLKGHLLLEEHLDRLLAVLLYKPEAIEAANLRFYQKLCLLRALAPEGSHRVVDAAEKLNTLRNRLSHYLDFPQIEAHVRDLLSVCEEPGRGRRGDPNREAVSLIRRLRNAITHVCGTFEGMVAFHSARPVEAEDDMN